VTLRRFLATLCVAAVVVMAIVVWFLPSDEDFRVENPFWNGARDLGSGDAVVPLDSLSELPDPPQGAVLILVPYVEFAAPELEAVGRFVTQGGTLVLADDYGYGNQVLEHLGMKERFSGQVLLDPFFNHRNERMPRVYNFEPGPVTTGVRSLALNHATCLVNVREEDVLGRSSSFSFLDADDSGTWDQGELTGPLPVISQHTLAGGRILLFSDPSIFINSMQTVEGNHKVVENLAGAAASRVFIDQSHLPRSDLDRTKVFLADLRTALVTPVGALALATLLLALTLRPLWYRKGEGIGETTE